MVFLKMILVAILGVYGILLVSFAMLLIWLSITAKLKQKKHTRENEQTSYSVKNKKN